MTDTPSIERTYRFAIIPEWIVFHPDLEPLDVRIFAILDRHGSARYPGHARLAALAGVSDRTMRRSVDRLVAVGAVGIDYRFDEHGRQQTNGYRLAGDAPLGWSPVTTPLVTDGQGGWSPTTTLEREPLTESSDREQSLSLQVVAFVPPEPVPTFDDFWTTYPRRTGKGAAEKCWAKLDGPTKQTIIAVLPFHVEAWRGKEIRFVPHPATWLNQRRWEDDIERPRTSNPFLRLIQDGDV